MKCPRFTLRFLLVVVTGAAVGLGVYRYLRPPLLPSEKAARSIKIGMTEDQVGKRLGSPESYRVEGLSMTWGYFVESPKGTEPGYISIDFDPQTGAVSSLKRTGRSEFVFPE